MSARIEGRKQGSGEDREGGQGSGEDRRAHRPLTRLGGVVSVGGRGRRRSEGLVGWLVG